MATNTMPGKVENTEKNKIRAKGGEWYSKKSADQLKNGWWSQGKSSV